MTSNHKYEKSLETYQFVKVWKDQKCEYRAKKVGQAWTRWTWLRTVWQFSTLIQLVISRLSLSWTGNRLLCRPSWVWPRWKIGEKCVRLITHLPNSTWNLDGPEGPGTEECSCWSSTRSRWTSSSENQPRTAPSGQAGQGEGHYRFRVSIISFIEI